MKKSIATGIYILLSAALSFAADTSCIQGRVQFATVEKAKVLLNTNDVYTNNLSRFDLNSKLHMPKGKNGTKEQQFQNITAQLREWAPEEKEKLNTVLKILDKNITDNGIHLNVPATLYFIKSTMTDEGKADGYTRGTCIVLKEGIMDMTDAALLKLVAHELFHVLTRNDSVFKKNMYGIIGFHLMSAIEYPQTIKDFKISNPDAPQTDSYIRLKKDSEPVECSMIIYSEKEYNGGEFFDYMTVRFLKLKDTDKKEIDYVNGEPVIFSFKEITGFIEQVGVNTQYIIDPEEILADNFVLAVEHKKDLPSQWLVDKMQYILKK